ncbi:peptide chain release factor 2 [Salmonella enterica subsp. enterica serovar Bareilly str. CFSAN000200]|nr:peptide chain release factor 2 [Salmonella enterica subsp. enterica serovar Bareilly str. CFSAN000200]
MFPAPAGINRQCVLVPYAFAGVPRASGDKPTHILSPFASSGCSPRQRG